MAFRTAAMFCRDQGPKILYYHDVHDSRQYYSHGTPLMLFKQHIAVLRNSGWIIVPCNPARKKECMLTFDDGFRGIWDCRSYFYEHGLRPTVFIAIDYVGKEGYLSWEEILELQEHGFNFECHTWTHRRLTEVPRTELCHELEDSKEYLSNKLCKPVTQLCFPQGRFNEKICKMAQDCGYSNYYSCIYGNADKMIMPNLLCRNLVQEVGTETFNAILNGGACPFWRRYYKQHCVPSID